MADRQSDGGGCEDVFKRDFNNDGIMGAPPAVDDNGDGLIDDSSTYKLFKDDANCLDHRRGGSFSDRSSRLWDIKQVSATETGLRCFLREKDGGEQVDTRCGELMDLV